MSTDERYDDDTVQRVGAWVPLGSPSARLDVARHILGALADAGLLLPPDIEANRQYGRRMASGMVLASALHEPTHYRLLGPWTEVPDDPA